MAANAFALLHLPLRRSLAPRRALLPVATLVAVAFVIARLARDQTHPADALLLETIGPALIPLSTFALARATLAGESLATAGEPLVDFGARDRAAAIAHALVATLLAALTAAMVTVAALVAAHDLPGDIVRSTAIAALAGAAYGALFTAFASFGRHGGGALFVLAADAVLGAGDGSFAAVTPHANLRSLFGGVPPLDFGPRTSFVALVAMGALSFFLIAVRTRRPRR
jgi:hypothetical protein